MSINYKVAALGCVNGTTVTGEALNRGWLDDRQMLSGRMQCHSSLADRTSEIQLREFKVKDTDPM